MASKKDWYECAATKNGSQQVITPYAKPGKQGAGCPGGSTPKSSHMPCICKETAATGMPSTGEKQEQHTLHQYDWAEKPLSA